MQRTRQAIRSSAPTSWPDRGLDAVNLLLAGGGSVYGAFIPVYLTGQAWTQTQIGLLLTISTIASMICQVPAGLIVDIVGPRRRRVLAIAVLTMGMTPLLLALTPRALPVLLAMLLQAVASTLLTPAVAAISLAVAGRTDLGERLGRNARYGSIGAGAGALVMGACVAAGLESGIFLIAAALTVPTFWAVAAIGPDRQEASAQGADADLEEPAGGQAWRRLLRDRRLLVFALCVAMFQVASVGVLQLAAVEVTARAGSRAGLVIAAFIILPQIVVAWLSPAIGRAAGLYGRRVVLLAGFATLPLRGALFALVQNPYALIPVQVLEGLGGAAFGVMLPLVAADLTRRTGYYTLCISLLGVVGGLGSAVSNTLAGWVTDGFGRPAAFWALAASGLAAAALVALAMPETLEPPAAPLPTK